MKLVGKFVGVFLVERRGAFGHLPAVPDRFHEVSHGEVLFDVVYAEKLASVVDGMGVFGDDPVGQRDIGGDHQVACVHHPDDRMIRFVGSRFDDDIAYVGGVPDRDPFIRDYDGRDTESFDSTKNDGLEQVGERVAVDVEGEWNGDNQAFVVFLQCYRKGTVSFKGIK